MIEDDDCPLIRIGDDVQAIILPLLPVLAPNFDGECRPCALRTRCRRQRAGSRIHAMGRESAALLAETQTLPGAFLGISYPP